MRTIICESVLDSIGKSETGHPDVQRHIPRPGYYDFCLMIPDATVQTVNNIRIILNVFADEYHFTSPRECPEINSVIDMGRLGNILDYDCVILEFNAHSLLAKVKALFQIFAHLLWCPAFVEYNSKWTFVEDNEEACKIATRLNNSHRNVSLDEFITLKNSFYTIIYPSETFDPDHANALDKVMDIIKVKCNRRRPAFTRHI